MCRDLARDASQSTTYGDFSGMPLSARIFFVAMSMLDCAVCERLVGLPAFESRNSSIDGQFRVLGHSKLLPPDPVMASLRIPTQYHLGRLWGTPFSFVSSTR